MPKGMIDDGVRTNLECDQGDLVRGRQAKRYKFELEERPLPTKEDVAKVAGERVIALLEADLRGRRSSHRERLQRFIPLAQELGELEDDDVIAMLLDDYYHKSLHGPQLPLEEPARAPRRREPEREPPARNRRRGRRRGS